MGIFADDGQGKYKSYTRAVVVALNDYFPESTGMKQIRIWKPEKGRCVSGKGGNSCPGWSERIRPDGYSEESDGNACTVCKESVGEINLLDRTLTMEKTDGEIAEDNLDWEKEADMDAALDLRIVFSCL